MMESEPAECGYFGLHGGLQSGPHPHSPGSVETAMSIELPSHPSPTVVALATLQYLPIPLLVLTADATVTLANEAMGRLLGIDWSATAAEGLTVAEALMDKSIAELGIDILQNGSPILVSWQVGQHYNLKCVLSRLTSPLGLSQISGRGRCRREEGSIGPWSWPTRQRRQYADGYPWRSRSYRLSYQITSIEQSESHRSHSPRRVRRCCYHSDESRQ